MREIKRLTPQTPEVIEGKSKYAPCLLSEAIYLDTETSHNYDEESGEGVGWVYQWAFTFCGEMAWGRRPSELMEALSKVARVNRLYNTKCVVYIQNLSYDIQYLKDWLISIYGEDDYKLIATNPHKFISFSIGPWVFRCTYKLANRSLAKWAKDMGTAAKKREGLIDYEVKRYQDTPLFRKDWVYMFYDVWTLEECTKAQLAAYGDNLATVPLTSTGYIRRDARKRFKEDPKNRKRFTETRLTPAVYMALRRAFAGGITHQNRFICDNIVTPPEGATIRHRDFRSHYPTQQVAKENGYPVSRFMLLYQYKDGGKPFTLEDIDKWSEENCLLIEIAIHDMEIKKGVTIPYAQSVKWYDGKAADYVPTIDDNGRVLRAQGTSVVSLTELDLKWIRKQYRFKYRILEVYAARRGPCPSYLLDTVKDKYHGKTAYKDKVKELRKAGAPANEILDAETSLMKSKNGLNGIYGMSATNPVRTDYSMDAAGVWSVEHLTVEMVEEKLDKFYKSRNSFMSYQLGVYVTAHARDELMTVVELIGYENILYVDTDSAFYVSTPESEARIKEYNERKQEHAEAIGAYITHNGKKTYFDAFDDEEEEIIRFRSLHAKAYGYETREEKDGKEEIRLHCTIAGVPERGRNRKTRIKELGSLENLRSGFVFKYCGGTRCVYIEHPPTTLDIDGHLTEVAGAAVILPVEKTLSGLITHEEYMAGWEVIEDDNDLKLGG